MARAMDFELLTHEFAGASGDFYFETGKLAPQADGSVLVKIGQNAIHGSCVMNKNPDFSKDFLPLMIDVRESFSAAGKFPGGFRKREGRPGDDVVLSARLTDRALRPLFPEGMINDVVISLTPMGIDQKFDLGVQFIVTASLAVELAGIPRDGLVGAARIVYHEGEFLVNPALEIAEKAELNLLVAGRKWSINMIESESREVSAEILKKAFEIGQREIDAVIAEQEKFVAKIREKNLIKIQEVAKNLPSDEVVNFVGHILTVEKLQKIVDAKEMQEVSAAIDELEAEVLEIAAEKIGSEDFVDFSENSLKTAVFKKIKSAVRRRTIEEKLRVDGRKTDEIRPLFCEVSAFPQVHGSGIFWRGDTQVASTVTLGAIGEAETQDSMLENDVEKRYLHHYSFPPFSVGEAKPTRGPGRREIGHGRLAEKALEFLIPSKEEFPYTIRVMSDCLSSGGSTSMGSVCGSTLALMDAGVPLKSPVAGIAMGLMTELGENWKIEKYQVLTDLMGFEDFMGDMDFKVAGTKKGVTAIQLDTKIAGLPMEIIHETIDSSVAGYQEIMDFMLETIPEPRAQVAETAPKIRTFKINPEKIREVIGRGGEVIDKIIETAGEVKVDFDDDGLVVITGRDAAAIAKAEELILEVVTDLEVGQIFVGKIARIEDYGVFVSLPKGKSGMVHVSKLGVPFGEKIGNRFQVGQELRVRIAEIDDRGRINLVKEE